jgi:hypothetical protein
MSFTFQIVIGDWSNDGHGRTKSFTFQANKLMKAVQSAYNKAKKILPKEISPEEFCNEYEDGQIPYDTWLKIVEHFPVTPGGITDPDRMDVYDNTKEETPRSPDPEWLARYTAEFTMKGDPELIITYGGQPPRLDTFGFLGYGLFWG